MAGNRDIQNNAEVETQRNEFERARRLFENRNYKEALSICLRLAETEWGRRNYPRIGWMYEFGMGTPKDVQQAEYWYRRAAEIGYPAGYYCLASMRFRAGKNDEVKELMEQAAAIGYAPALFHLGQMYRFGKGVPVDRIKAYEYYEQAAAQGHLFAQRQIAQKLIRGECGPWRVSKGFLMVAKIVWNGFKLKLKDPSNDRLRRLA